MGVVELPDFIEGREFEEYISAFFQVGGRYVERNIIERDIVEVLELDIITTEYSNTEDLKINLIEVKSGRNWGFSDLFKIYGWMRYLGIDKGIFITKEKKEANGDFFINKAQQLNVDLIPISDLNKTGDELSGIINNQNINNEDIGIWRYSYWLERKLLEKLKQGKKSQPENQCFKYLDSYYFKVNNEIFFTEPGGLKLKELFDIFKEKPHISAKCGCELIGENFEECDSLPKEIYEKTYYECDYNPIQISTFIEHRARLAILKNAIDYKLNENSNNNKTIDGFNVEKYLEQSLPYQFRNGLDEIVSNHKYFYRYPVFWQWFFWVFGGFILKDYEEIEYKLLSEKTGIPIDEIPNALKSYEILFPQEGGWFMDLSLTSETNISMVKLFPVSFMGIGANYRRWLYSQSNEWEDMNLSGKYTLENLVKWNNLAVEILEK